jgi:acylphosphatase
MKIAKHLRIEGRVQGVGFRYELQSKAQQLGLSGWVRNRYDDSVEAVICGDNMREIDELVIWARRGPRLAIVSRVVVSETEIPLQDGFVILSKA